MGARRLVVDGRDVAPAAVARSRRARRRGLLGRPPGPGALVLARTRSVHGLGMDRSLDVALCAPDGRVVAVRRLRPGGLVWPTRGTRWAVEADEGAFERWGLQVGSIVGVR